MNSNKSASPIRKKRPKTPATKVNPTISHKIVKRTFSSSRQAFVYSWDRTLAFTFLDFRLSSTENDSFLAQG